MSIRSEMTSITSDKIPTRATSYHTSMADSDFPCRAAHELCWRVSTPGATDIRQSRTK